MGLENCAKLKTSFFEGWMRRWRGVRDYPAGSFMECAMPCGRPTSPADRKTRWEGGGPWGGTLPLEAERRGGSLCRRQSHPLSWQDHQTKYAKIGMLGAIPPEDFHCERLRLEISKHTKTTPPDPAAHCSRDPRSTTRPQRGHKNTHKNAKTRHPPRLFSSSRCRNENTTHPHPRDDAAEETRAPSYE